MLIDRFNYRALETPTRPFDSRHHFMLNLPLYHRWAEDAANRADTYRVSVGYIFVARNVVEGMLGVFASWNDKPYKALQKRCAEPKTWSEARSMRYTVPVGEVIKGPEDVDVIKSVAPYATHTILNCDNCLHTRSFYEQEGDMQFSDADVTVTTRGLYLVSQAHTQGEIAALRGHGDAGLMPPDHEITDVGSRDWGAVMGRYQRVRSTAEASRDYPLNDAEVIRQVLVA